MLLQRIDFGCLKAREPRQVIALRGVVASAARMFLEMLYFTGIGGKRSDYGLSGTTLLIAGRGLGERRGPKYNQGTERRYA